MLDCPEQIQTSPTMTLDSVAVCGPVTVSVYGPPAVNGPIFAIHLPSAPGDGFGRLAVHADGDGLPRRRPAPDGVGDAALQDHVVGEQRMQERLGVVRPRSGRLNGESRDEEREKRRAAERREIRH